MKISISQKDLDHIEADAGSAYLDRAYGVQSEDGEAQVQDDIDEGSAQEQQGGIGHVWGPHAKTAPEAGGQIGDGGGQQPDKDAMGAKQGNNVALNHGEPGEESISSGTGREPPRGAMSLNLDDNQKALVAAMRHAEAIFKAPDEFSDASVRGAAVALTQALGEVMGVKGGITPTLDYREFNSWKPVGNNLDGLRSVYNAIKTNGASLNSELTNRYSAFVQNERRRLGSAFDAETADYAFAQDEGRFAHIGAPDEPKSKTAVVGGRLVDVGNAGAQTIVADKRRAAVEQMRQEIAADQAIAAWLAVAPSLTDSANALVRKAFYVGGDNLSMRNTHISWFNGEDYNVFERLPDDNKETVAMLIGLSRGKVYDPQWWTDTFRGIARQTKYLATGAIEFGRGLLMTPVNYLFGSLRDEGFTWQMAANQARRALYLEAVASNAAEHLEYQDYGVVLGGLKGTLEQIPIWATLGAGSVLSSSARAASAGRVVQGAANISAQATLASMYAAQSRDLYLMSGADLGSATLFGILSGVGQALVETAQGEALIGKGLTEKATAEAIGKLNKTFIMDTGKVALKKLATREGAHALAKASEAVLLNTALETVEEGLQRFVETTGECFATKDYEGLLSRTFQDGLQEIKDTASTMFFSSLFGFGMTQARSGKQVAAFNDLLSARVNLEKLPATSENLKSKFALFNADGSFSDERLNDMRQAWRMEPSAEARQAFLEGKATGLTPSQASLVGHLFTAQERISARYGQNAIRALFSLSGNNMGAAADLSAFGSSTFSLDATRVKTLLNAVGFTGAEVVPEADGGGFAVRIQGRDKTSVAFALRQGPSIFASEISSPTEGGAASVFAALPETSDEHKDGWDHFKPLWMNAEADGRRALISKYHLTERGNTKIGRNTIQVVTPEGQTSTIDVNGLISLVRGDTKAVGGTGATMIHETLHAIVGLLRETGTLDEADIGFLQAAFGKPKTVGELFDEESAADALAYEVTRGGALEAAERVSGVVNRALPDKTALGRIREVCRKTLDAIFGFDMPFPYTEIDRQGDIARNFLIPAFSRMDFSQMAKVIHDRAKNVRGSVEDEGPHTSSQEQVSQNVNKSKSFDEETPATSEGKIEEVTEQDAKTREKTDSRAENLHASETERHETRPLPFEEESSAVERKDAQTSRHNRVGTVVDMVFDRDAVAAPIPTDEIVINERIPQFKENVDPRTGVNPESRIGQYAPTLAKPIRVMRFEDGVLEVITGRHRLEAARRAGEKTIPAIVYDEADGMTVELAKALDAAENIMESKGSRADFTRFFRNTTLSADALQRLGLTRTGNRQVLAAHAIGTRGTSDVFSWALDPNTSEARFLALGAVARAPKVVQSALLDMVLKRGVNDPSAIETAGRILAAGHTDAEPEQSGLFGDDDPVLEEARQIGLGVADITRGLAGEARTLSRAILGAKDMVLREETKHRLGISNADDKAQLQRAYDRVRQEIAAWESPTISGEKREQALARGREIDRKREAKQETFAFSRQEEPAAKKVEPKTQAQQAQTAVETVEAVIPRTEEQSKPETSTPQVQAEELKSESGVKAEPEGIVPTEPEGAASSAASVDKRNVFEDYLNTFKQKMVRGRVKKTLEQNRRHFWVERMAAKPNMTAQVKKLSPSTSATEAFEKRLREFLDKGAFTFNVVLRDIERSVGEAFRPYWGIPEVKGLVEKVKATDAAGDRAGKMAAFRSLQAAIVKAFRENAGKTEYRIEEKGADEYYSVTKGEFDYFNWLRAQGWAGAQDSVLSDAQARFSLTSVNPEIGEEAHAVFERYHTPDGMARPGYLRAPNGERTNLTERQWLQVRTPSFKRWFGDWEKVAVANAILGDADIVAENSLLDMPPKEQRIAAKALYDELKANGPVDTRDGRSVRFTGVGFKEIKSHSADPHTLAIVPILREVVASARYIGEGDVDATAANKDVRAYHIYARRVNLGDGSMVARIVIREDKNGNQFYDEESTSLEKVKEIQGQGSRDPNTGSGDGSPYAPHSLAEFFGGINPDAVSKVVDENGEPLVVYHGTGTDFNAFDPLRQGENYLQSEGGFFFTTNREIARHYAKYHAEDGEGRVIEAYLSIRTPYESSAYGDDLGAPIEKYDDHRSEYLSEADIQGCDGISITGEKSTLYVAFSPTQIKSAEANTGAFDAANPDIRYSVHRASPEEDAAYLEAVKRGDMETAQTMVDAAAKGAGYDSPVLYHGTPHFGFTQFDLSKMDDGHSIFLTNSPAIASTYSGVEGSRRVADRSSVDVNNLSGQEIAEMLNHFSADSGIVYEYLDMASQDAFENRVRADLEKLDGMIAQILDRHDVDYINREVLRDIQDAARRHDYERLASLLHPSWWPTNTTTLFDGNMSFVKELMRNAKSVVEDKRVKGEFIRYTFPVRGGRGVNRMSIKEARKFLLWGMSRGNYSLYAKLGNALMVDAHGDNWSALDFRVPDSKYEILEEDGYYRIYDKSAHVIVWENGINLWNSREEAQGVIDGLPDKNGWVKRLHNTRQVAAYAKKQGYDSVVFKDLRDNGGQNRDVGFDTLADIYVIFNPSDVKSADPVIRDDSGRVIPLSERFNPRNEDIRFSIARIPEEGMLRADAAAVLDTLKGGVFVNRETGLPARLSSTGVGKLISNNAVAKSMANGFTAAQHNALAARIDSLYQNAMLVEDRPDRNGDVNIRSIKRLVCPVQVGSAEAGAYITVKESVEHGNRLYSVEGIKIAALPPTVRRVLANRNSADNAAMLGDSIPHFADGGERRFSLSRAVEETPHLIAVHNLSEKNLVRAIELGGFPMPSLAIVKDSQGHDEFGDISALFRRETIDPASDRRNRVYGGDAWTPVFPRVEYKADSKVEKRVRDKYYELSRKYGYESTRAMQSYEQDLSAKLTSAGGEAAMLEKLYGDEDMMQIYLEDTGKGRVENVVREMKSVLTDGQARQYDILIDTLGREEMNRFAVKDGESPISVRKAFLERNEAGIREAFARTFTESGMDAKTAAEVSGELDRGDLMKYVREAYKYMLSGRETVKQEIDYAATKDAIREKAGGGYQEWVRDLFGGAEEKSGIRNNKDMFTFSGNRRSFDALHYELTLENVVRVMREEEQKGGGSLFGGQSIWGAATKDYGSIGEIKADSGRLGTVSEDEYKAIRQKYTERFAEIANEIMDRGADNSFIAADDAAEILVDALRKKKTVAAIDRELRKYSQLNIQSDTAQKAYDLFRDISEMPTRYFEAKPQRAVGVDEVQAWIVPEDLTQGLMARLLGMEQRVYTYQRGDAADRLRVVNQAATDTNVRFSVTAREALNNQTGVQPNGEGSRVQAGGIEYPLGRLGRHSMGEQRQPRYSLFRNLPAQGEWNLHDMDALNDAFLASTYATGIIRAGDDEARMKTIDRNLEMAAKYFRTKDLDAVRKRAAALVKQNAGARAIPEQELVSMIGADAYDRRVKEKMAYVEGYAQGTQDYQEMQAGEEALKAYAEQMSGVSLDVMQDSLGFSLARTLLLMQEQRKGDPAGKEKRVRRSKKPEGGQGEQAESETEEEQIALPEGLVEEARERYRAIREAIRKRADAALAEEIARREAAEKEKEAKRKEKPGKQTKEREKPKKASAKEVLDVLGAEPFVLAALRQEGVDFENPEHLLWFVQQYVADKYLTEKQGDTLTDLANNPLFVRELQMTLVELVVRLADDLCYTAQREHVKRLANRILQAKKSLEETRGVALQALNRLHSARIKEARKAIRIQMIARINETIGTQQVSIGKEASERQVSGDFERYLAKVRAVLKMSTKAIDDKRETWTNILRHRRTDLDEDDAAITKNRDIKDGEEWLAVINKYGAHHSMMPGQLDDLRADLEDGLHGAIQEALKKKAEFEAEIKATLDPLVLGIAMNEPGTKPDDSGVKGKLNNLANNLQSLMHLQLRRLVWRSTGGVRKNALRAIEVIELQLGQAFDRKNALKSEWMDKVAEGVAKIYGTPWKARKALRRKIPLDVSRKISKQGLHLTVGQTLALYAYLTQTDDYASNIKIHERGGEDYIRQVRSALSSKELQLLIFMRNFLADIFPLLQSEYRDITGTTVYTTRNYFPVKMKMEERLPAYARAWSPIVTAMQPRVRNSRDVDENTDAFDLFFARLEDYAQMVGYGKAGIFLRDTLGSQPVLAAVRRAHGDKEFHRLTSKVVDVLAGTRSAHDETSIALKASRWVSLFSLSWNLLSIGKQLTSGPIMMNDDNVGVAKGLWWGVRNLFPTAETRRVWGILRTSPGFRARYGHGLSAEMADALAQETNALGFFRKMYRAGMKPTEVADFLAGFTIACGYFQKREAELLAQGLSQAKAQDIATTLTWNLLNRTQQSGRTEDQYLSVRNSKLARLVFQFINSPVQQAQYTVAAMQSFFRGEEGGGTRVAHALVGHALSVAGISLVKLLWDAALGEYAKEDGDDKEKLFKEWAADFVLNLLAGDLFVWPLVGDAIQGVVYTASTGDMPPFRVGSGIPAIDQFNRAARSIKRGARGLIWEDVSADDPKAFFAETLDEMLKATVPLYRHADRATKNWTGKDLVEHLNL